MKYFNQNATTSLTPGAFSVLVLDSNAEISAEISERFDFVAKVCCVDVAKILCTKSLETLVLSSDVS